MDYFLNYINRINQIKSDFDYPLSWIFNYKIKEDLFLNTIFFDKKNWNISDIDIDILLLKINKKKLEVQKYIKEIEFEENELSSFEKSFFLENLKKLKNKFSLIYFSVYLEAEKNWYNLDINDRKKYLKKVNSLQNIIYWPEISSIKNEEKNIIIHLYDLFLKNNKKLNKLQYKLYLNFFENYDYLYYLKNNHNLNNHKEEKINNNFLTKKYLSISKIKKIFNLVLKIYGLNNWKFSYDKNIPNFHVNNVKKIIVVPIDKLLQTSVYRLLQIFDHEIWVHVIRKINSENKLNLLSEDYLEIEEWFASFVELLVWNDIKDVVFKPTIHHISTYFAEKFDWEITRKMIEVYYRLIEPRKTSMSYIKNEALLRTLRVKRFVSYYEKWANRKDVTYTRWQEKIYNFLKNTYDEDIKNKFIKNFYFAKLWFNDILNIDDFKKNLNNNDNIVYPIWLWKIIYTKLNWSKSSLKNDFRFNKLNNKISHKVKKDINSIIDIINYKKN